MSDQLQPLVLEDITLVCDWLTGVCKVILPVAYRAAVETAWANRTRNHDESSNLAFLGPVLIEWEQALPAVPDRVPTPEQIKEVHDALAMVGEWPDQPLPEKRTPNLHKGKATCTCAGCVPQYPPRWDNVRIPDQVENDAAFIHTTDLSSKLVTKNDLYTSGTNADFNGDAVLSGGCGYCSNHELMLNGRSLTEIVAFLQQTESMITEPFEVSLHIRAKPRKD